MSSGSASLARIRRVSNPTIFGSLYTEWVPIVPNTQDYARMTRDVVDALAKHSSAHGLLLRGHGLYTWGHDLAEARRHVEAFEFLFEVTGRLLTASGSLPARSAGVGAGG